MRRTIVSLALAGAVATAAAAPQNITDGELALTPPYCQDVQGIRYGDAYYNTSPRAGYWLKLMGPTFWAMHHYCWALINLHRMPLNATLQVRQATAQSALGDYGYVLQHSSPDFILLPEIYTRIGEAHLLGGSMGDAYAAFERARGIKPDYWPPYERWAAVLIKTNQKAEAKKLVAEGLRHSPDAKPLIEKYRQLGGNPADIQPLRKQAAAGKETVVKEVASKESAAAPAAAESASQAR